MSKIRDELMKAADLEPKKGEEHNALGKRIVLAVGDLADKDWNKISQPAQEWFNKAATAYNEKEDIPDFPDAEKEEEEKPSRARVRSSGDEKPAKEEAYEPKRKDMVKITNKRGKVYEGKIVEMDKDEIVLETADGEEAIDRDRIDSIEPLRDDGKPSRGGKEEPEEPADPEVGDTVQITTSRDKVVMGKVTELTDDTIVIEKVDGEVDDYSRDRLKSVVVKVKGKAGGKSSKDDEKPSRGKVEKEEPAKDEKKRTTKADNGGVSATLRIRELIADDIDASKEDIVKKARKEGLEFKDNTADLIYADCHKLIKMLKERKLLK